MSSILLPLLGRFALFFEPISPRFVSLWLGRGLKNWRSRGLIDDYKVKTRRIGKFHYRVEVDLDLSPQQANWVLKDTLRQMLRRVGR